MAISFGGLGNGVDFGPIVEFLVQAKRIPIDRINQQKLDSQEKLTDLGLLGTKLLNLQSAASTIRTRLGFDKNQVNVTSASTQNPLTASASSTAGAGTYLITVNQLASAHQIVSKSTTAVTAVDTDIVSGASGTFSFQVGSGTLQTVNLDADGTLEDLRDGINNLGAGVSASLLNTGTEAAPQFRLVLSSNETGSDNAITITSDDTDLDTVTSGVDVFQAALDAEIELGVDDVGPPATTAVTITRSSNTITDAIDGLTLNLQAVDTSNPVTVSVTQDTEAVKEGVANFVNAYNEVVSFINERTNYDVETQERGIFVGESLARTVLDQMRNAVFSQVDGLTTYTGASQIGFETQTSDGTIKFNEETFDQAISENYSAVRDLFIQNPTTNTEGIAELIVDAVDAIDDVESGALTLRQNSLTDQIDSLTEQIALKEEALLRFEEQQRIKFANLDGLLASLQSQLEVLQTRLPTNS